jgi:quinol monooxygenase YgiN
MSDRILVTGVIDLDPAKRDEAIAVLTAAMEATRAEAGCEHYVFSADLTDPGRFHVSEQWANQAANDAHGAGPALATLMGAMGSLGVTGASLTAWTGAEPKKLM